MLTVSIIFQDYASEEVNSRVNGWVESSTEVTTHTAAHQEIVDDQSHQQKHYSVAQPQNFSAEQRKRVMQPIHIPQKTYQVLQAELYKSKTRVNSFNEDVVDEVRSHTFNEEVSGEKDLSQATALDPGVPNIVISQDDTETSRKDITAETTVVTVHKQVTDVADDQASVSLLDDVPENDHVDDVSYENHQENHPDLQVDMNTRKSFK